MSLQRFNHLKKIISTTGFVYDVNRNRIIIQRSNGKMLYLADSKEPAEFIHNGDKVGDVLYIIPKETFYDKLLPTCKYHLLNYDYPRIVWGMKWVYLDLNTY